MNDNQAGTGEGLIDNPQKAELTNLINKMKQGNPPATEGEIAKVIEDYKAKNATTSEGAGIEIGSYDDDLDMSNTKTIIDKSEGQVVDAYLDSPDHPGLAVEKAGFMFGDAVNFVRPDGSRVYVDLQNDLENEQKKLDELNTWYGENEEKASLGLWGTLGAASPSADAYDQVAEIENVNTSLGKMYSEGGNNYRVVTSSTREAGMYDTGAMKVNSYKLTSDTGDDIEFEEWGDLQKHLWDNVTEEELGMLREADLDEADAVIKESKEVEAKRYSDLTDDDVMSHWVKEGGARIRLESKIKDLNLSAEDQALFDKRLAYDDKIAKEWESTWDPFGLQGSAVEDRFKMLHETVDSDYSEEGSDKIKSLLQTLNLPLNDEEKFNKVKLQMTDDFGSKWVQTKLKSHPNYRGIQAALDAETSSENMKPQFQAHKDRFKNLEDSAKADIKKIDARTRDILGGINRSKSNGSDIGYTTTEINGKHIITVTGADEGLVKRYQDQINKQQGLYNNVLSEYKQEHGNVVDKYDTWRAEAGDYAKVAGISNRELDTFTLMGEDLLGGFEQMALGMPAAFGSEAAMDGLDALQAESESLAMDLGYDEAWELGETGSYVGRSISKQTANVAVAVAASSLGMPPVAVEATVGTIFGLGAGGQKRQQLRTASRMAEQAKLDMVELEALKDSMDPEEYAEQMAQLKKIEAVGDLSRAQIESIVWGTAAIEGVVTAKLGTLPNSRAMVKVFGGKAPGFNPFLTGNQRIGDFLWKFGKGVGGEIAEEEIILFGGEILEGTINREHDISFAEWDETLVQAVLLAGPMNGPSGAYSSVTQHMMGKPYREIFDDVVKVQARLDRELKDPNTTEAEKKKVQAEMQENLDRIGIEGSGLEVDAMVTGVEGLRELAATAFSLNRLYVEAGVKHTDSESKKQDKIDEHIAKLEEKSKTEAQSFKDRYDRVNRDKAKIRAATEAKYEENTALEEGGIIEQIYGPEGLKMALEMNSGRFKKLSNREKLIAVHEKIKKDFIDNNIAEAKRNDKVKEMVESMVYDEVDDDGNKLEGGKEGYFKRNNRKRRTSEQVKREEKLYRLWATQQNSREVESITLNKDVTLKAPPSLTEADIKSFDDILDNKGEVVETAQQQLENFINKQEISDRRKREIIDGFRKGEVNGTIIDGKYIVLDAAQAKKNLAKGTLLQATAVLHEYSHFLDNVTMKDGEMVQMAENLNESLESNSILKLLHDAVVERGSNIFDSDGNPEYDPDLPFKEQSNKAKEEYVKYAEEMLLQNEFWRQLNEAKKVGAGIGNTLRGFVGGDFNFKSKGSALHYIVAYGQSWLRGEDSILVERKKKAFIPRKNTEESTTSESRNARDGFAERTIAKDLGLRESTRKIVEKNEEIYQRIVKAAEVNGVKISKALVTQLMKDELIENNLARAFALARKAAGVARNLTLDEGLKIDNVTEWFQEYSLKLAELANTWDPSKNDSFGAYMNQLLPKKYSGILEGLKNDLETSSIDTDEGTRARAEVIEVESETDQGPDTRRKKTNVLKIGKVEGKVDAIRDVVDVDPGDTFKEVSDNNTGKVAEIIFDVPADKITDPKKNLTYAKKIVDGIPEASEAGNIQSFYIAPQTVEKLLKILPEESVSSDTADINEIGENIDVDREVLGRGLGLSNRVLNSFYEKTNKRSKGKKSQPFIWKLKPEFKNPTAGTIAKVQEDLGITARGELNNYNRDIGQLLKGVAKFQAQQTALSTAQRILTEQNAPKKQIASVTTAQSKVAFSQNISEVGKFMRQNLSIDDAKFRDNLLLANNLAPTLRINSPEDIKVYIDMLKRDVFPLLPYEAWFGPGKGTAFTSSSKSVGLSSSSDLWALFQSEMQALKSDESIEYGAPINGVDLSKMWSLRNKYTPLFSTPKKARENIKNGKIAEFNEQIGLIHEALWKRINKSIKDNRDSASSIATYLGLTANDTGHWHKMGAQFEGFSKELTGRKKDKKGKDQKIRVEYEHAMPATQAYLYLLNAAINHNESFDYTYGKIIENYKLIALDKAMDDKLRYARTKSGKSLMTNMTDGWNPETGFWWERYFNDIAYMQDGGIDPSSIEGLDGKTFAEKLNINAQGVDPAFEFARDIDERSKDSKVMDEAFKMSRSSTKPKGITVLDFDDTLATTKSSVLYTMPGESQWEFTADGNLYNVSKLASGKLRIVNNKTGSIVSSKSPYAKLLSYHMMIERGASEQELQKTAKRMFFGGKVPTGATLKKAQGKVSSSSKLTAEEFAKQGGDLLAEGAVFDFSEFNEVVDGKTAPLFNKAMKLAGKFGTDNMFILTARAPQSAKAIKQFLDSQGLKIPLKNITGLGKSEASAKANWIAEKVGEGYNDFYFADDAMQNVEAVRDMLDLFDVKGKVQQARVNFSQNASNDMNIIIDETALDLNKILEETKGISKDKSFSAAKARQRGKNKGRFKFFVPPSADDFAGLMYSFMGRGKQGDRHHAWFKENLFDPFSKGMRRHKTLQQQVANDMRNLRKAMPDVRKKLGKKVPGTEYTHEDAIRIYNWSQAGLDIPGLSQADATVLIKAVESDVKLKAFAQAVNSIANVPGGMVEPGSHWTGGNIALDLKEALDNARSTSLQQWVENKNIIFSEANMNKIEAVYGSNFREALEDSLYRMETGSTRNVGKDRLLNNFTAWIHGSIGTTMFLNARSAMLQMISNVNFVNWSDNNMLKAAGAFANQKQYWKDVSMIFNSPFLKQRRSGIQTDVNAAELLAQIKDSKNKMKAAVAYLLQLGFTPTQIADSLAIATGGATFYRNRTKTYLKDGMTQADAETKAFEDMMEIAEETQQSTRADKISQQQASPIGKFILAFQNTPMQYNRLIKKAAQDLVNGRGDTKANVSRIVYYGAIQNLIFYGLQTALFAALFSDDEEDEVTGKKTERVVNGMVDTLLRGSGIGGAIVSTVKNVIMKFLKESEKMNDGIYYTDPDWGNVVIEALNISPPIGIKARKIYSGLKTWEYNKDVIDYMDKTDLDNPAYDAAFSVTEAVTNVPLSRMYNKFQNISEAFNSDHDTWKRVAMLLGWSKWSFGIKNQDVVDAKGKAKTVKASEKKEGNRNTFIDDQKKEKDEGKRTITCAASTRSGGRCSNKVVGGGNHCTVHEKVKQRADGEKKQCSHVKANGKRCKMKTTNKSGKCYYHD